MKPLSFYCSTSCLLGMILSFGSVCFGADTRTPQENRSAESIVIEHVTVLSMAPGSAPLSDATVVIRGDRISAINAPSAAINATRIDGRGKWLIPGLTDMHVHVENVRMIRLMLRAPDVPQSAVRSEDVFAPYLANGVLQIFDLQGMAESIGRRGEIEAGHLRGPRIVTAAMIDGVPPIWPLGMTRVAATPEDGRQAVRDAAAEGYDAIKVYSQLTLETFTAIVDEARKLNLPVVGHIPERHKGTTAEFFQPGFRMVAHAEEFALCTAAPDISAIPRYIEMMKKNGTWLTSTLSLDERLVEETEKPETLKERREIQILHPLWRTVVLDHNPYVAQRSPERIEFLKRVVAFNRELIRAFVAAGVPVVAGTDSMVPGVVPGYSMHDELEALTRAGMSRQQALEAATRLPCEWLGLGADRGTIETGKRADLVLLDANPLEDITNTRRIAGIFLGGKYIPSATLNEWMDALAKR